ncbi:MAG: LamG-like jellyroll fold domain-containing protein [bacterium]
MRILLVTIIISGVACLTQGGQIKSDANTVALYNFNQTSGSVINDSGPYNLSGSGYSISMTTGIFGYAAYLDGSSDYITIQNTNGAFSFNANQSFTLEIWFQLYSTRTSTVWLISHNYGGTGYSLVLNTLEQLVFTVQGENNITYQASSQSSAVSPTKWYYTAAVYNGPSRKLEIYINGKIAGTASVGSDLQGVIGTLTAPFYISGSGSYSWYGLFDDCRISNKARTAQEISSHWDENKSAVSGPEIIPITGPINNPKPAFRWQPVNGATAYTFQVSITGSFSNPLISVPTSNTFYTPILDLPVGQIYWRVASDVNPELYSETGNFTLQDKNIPILIPMEPDPTLSRRPTFKWRKVQNAAAYQLIIDRTSSFSSPLVSTPMADTSFTPIIDLPSGNIYWKVKSDLSETFSEVDYFIIQNDSTPVLYGFKGDSIANSRPTFRWKPVTDATAYILQIHTTQSFSNPYISTPVAAASYTPLVSLQQGVKYFWRVSSDLLPNQYSPVDSLVIDTTRAGILFNSALAAGRSAVYAFPNPGRAHIRIGYNTGDWGRGILNIFNPDGRTVFSMKVKRSGIIKWNTDKFSSGLYVSKLVTGNKSAAERFIIIK